MEPLESGFTTLMSHRLGVSGLRYHKCFFFPSFFSFFVLCVQFNGLVSLLAIPPLTVCRGRLDQHVRVPARWTELPMEGSVPRRWAPSRGVRVQPELQLPFAELPQPSGAERHGVQPRRECTRRCWRNYFVSCVFCVCCGVRFFEVFRWMNRSGESRRAEGFAILGGCFCRARYRHTSMIIYLKFAE